MPMRLKAGDALPKFTLQNIHLKRVAIPDQEMRWTHLQLRRFAGCPACNLHLQSFVRRHVELVAAGIREVVVFHSSDAALMPFQGAFPFDVIGDPQKKVYQQLGVDSSILAVLNPAALVALMRGAMLRNKPRGSPENGPLGRPADFLISPDGLIARCHYGTHAYDQWSLEQVLAFAKEA